MWDMVSPLSMVFMAVTGLVCVLVPLGAMLGIWSRRDGSGSRRWPRVWRAFWCGALAFTVSQVLLRIPLMTLVVPQFPEPVAGFLLSGPVASYTAGLFEETGRLVVMLLLLKAFHRWIDGVSFGLGHGGIEATLIVGLSTVNNLVVATLINTGQWDAVAAALPAEQTAQIHGALVDAAPWMFLLAGVERLAAMTLHIACSLIVLAGIVHGRKLIAWIAAVVLHGTFNVVAVLMVGGGVSPLLIEAVLVALALGLWVGIVRSRPAFPTEITSEVAPAPRVG